MGAQRWDSIVIGAGVGGLAAAARLAAAGHRVCVLERHAHVGGKIRTLDSAAGPVDAGPTVLTMAPVFEGIFTDAGAQMADYVTLTRQSHLARHFWDGGAHLDLYDDHRRNMAAIAAFSGPQSAQDFEAFAARTARLFAAFRGPVMTARRPSLPRLLGAIARDPGLVRAMAPGRSMRALLARSFSDKRLAQLFGRYATYVGGSPEASPALACLIWEAERAGVWQAKGGMHHLAEGIARLATDRGAHFRFGADVRGLDVVRGAIQGVTLAGGEVLRAPSVVFNGDPAALQNGLLGEAVSRAVPASATRPRSHSAQVWSFAATPQGAPLALHNVFFAGDPQSEFADLAAGRIPSEPSLYVHAQDAGATTGPGRFEIILNAPPRASALPDPTEYASCQTRTFQRLSQMGLSFEMASAPRLSTPATFADLFPGSMGSIYGRSPHGMMATFQRPTARTKIRGLYLAGGGCHPGAGIPMAALSGRHAAEAILQGRISRPKFRPMATPGGMSTGYPMTGSGPSR